MLGSRGATKEKATRAAGEGEALLPDARGGRGSDPGHRPRALELSEETRPTSYRAHIGKARYDLIDPSSPASSVGLLLMVSCAC